MRLKKMKYQFKEFDHTPPAFTGMSLEDFRLVCNYLDDVTPPGFRKAHGFAVIASIYTRLGVIDCFVN